MQVPRDLKHTRLNNTKVAVTWNAIPIIMSLFKFLEFCEVRSGTGSLQRFWNLKPLVSPKVSLPAGIPSGAHCRPYLGNKYFIKHVKKRLLNIETYERMPSNI
jgi:hypothetical protein